MLNGQLSNYTNEQLSKYTNWQLSLLSFLEYIYDRSYVDVERWRELQAKGWDSMTDTERSEWLGEVLPTPTASKGMYTHNDFNRVESAVEAVALWLRDMGYKIPPMDIKTDWAYTDTVTIDEMTRYFSNIETIRSVFAVFPDTPITPSVNENFDYIKANNIEKILSDIFDISGKVGESWCYSGEIILGEV